MMVCRSFTISTVQYICLMLLASIPTMAIISISIYGDCSTDPDKRQIAMEMLFNGTYTPGLSLFSGVNCSFTESRQGTLSYTGTISVVGDVTAYAVVILCALATSLHVRRNYNPALSKMNNLNKQMTITLMAQATVPFFFTLVPYFGINMAALLDVPASTVLNFACTVYPWTPLINPIICIYTVKPFRTAFRKLVWAADGESTASIQVSEAVSVRRNQTVTSLAISA